MGNDMGEHNWSPEHWSYKKNTKVKILPLSAITHNNVITKTIANLVLIWSPQIKWRVKLAIQVGQVMLILISKVIWKLKDRTFQSSKLLWIPQKDVIVDTKVWKQSFTGTEFCLFFKKADLILQGQELKLNGITFYN